MIYLIRHAEAERGAPWAADRDQPLTTAGCRQAGNIAEALIESDIGRILTSPHLRCRQTVEPLAEAAGIALEPEHRLQEGTPVEEVAGLIAEIGERAALCTHGDVVADLMGSAAASGAELRGGFVWEKGSIWELEMNGGRITAGRYRPPTQITGTASTDR